jgi:hypothetical protein
VMHRVLVTGSRARTDTTTIPGALATAWGGGTAVLVSGSCPTGADPIAETIRTVTPDLHGGLCAGHPYPSLWDAELDGVCESAARRARRHCVAQTICRRCPIMAACLASRTGNPQLGGGVWGGEVFQEKESTAGEPAPSKPVAADPVETARKQRAPTGSRRHCPAPLTEQQARRRGTDAWPAGAGALRECSSRAPLPAGSRRSGSPTDGQHDPCIGESGAWPGPCGPPPRTGRAPSDACVG